MIGTASQASEFTQISSYLINHIKKSYKYGNDIATALENKTPFDMKSVFPTLQVSTEQDNAVAAAENKQFEMLFKAQLDKYVEREAIYESNCGNAYAFLYEHCNKTMQNKIKSRSDFDSKIKNDPIELLKAIEEQSISYQEKRYEFSTITDAIKNFINAKQRDDEPLSEWNQRFKSARDIMVSQIGAPIVFKKVITESGKSLDDESVVQKVFNQWTAFLFLENSDRLKYGSVATNLQSQFSLGNKQYPETLADINSVLSGRTKRKESNSSHVQMHLQRANQVNNRQKTLKWYLLHRWRQDAFVVARQATSLPSVLNGQQSLRMNGLSTRLQRWYMHRT